MSIRLHSKYGLNPCIPHCFFCNEAKNELLLLGANGGREAPRKAVFDKVPCATCKGYMEKGVILISAKEPKPGEDASNPFRTGGFWVVTDAFIQKAIKPPEVAESALKSRAMFISNAAAKGLQLPGWEKLLGAVVDVKFTTEPAPPPAADGGLSRKEGE